jgi:hypothetical protein
MTLQVIDNFLPQEEFLKIKKIMIGSLNLSDRDALPWYIQNTKSGSGIFLRVNGDNDTVYNYQFNHIFYALSDNNVHISDRIEVMYPISEKLRFKKPLRIKANLTPITPKLIVYGFHTDFELRNIEPMPKTAIYYVNTNNGYTVFENGDKVESIENRICIFDENLRHSGTSCTDERFRCVINFNFVM